MKKRFSIILRVLVSAGLLAFLVFSMRDNLPHIVGALSETSVPLFALAACSFVFLVGIMSLRLDILLKGEGLEIPFMRITQLTFIGYFFNNFMPTAVGGDIVKAYYANRHTGRMTESFIAVFMDRFLGLFSFVLLACLALALSWRGIDPGLRKAVLLFGFLGAVMLFAILNSACAKLIFGGFSRIRLWGIGAKLARIYREVHSYRAKKRVVLAALGVSCVSQSVFFIIVFILAKSLDMSLSIVTVFTVMPIVCVVSMLPSLGGLGLREGAMVALLGPAIGKDNAFSVSILLLAVLLIISVIGAVIYLSAAQFRISPEKLAEFDSRAA